MKIIHSDALTALADIPDASIDMVFTDPPYGHNNNNNGDLIHRWEAALGRLPSGEDTPQARKILNDGPEANDLFRSVLPELFRVLKPGSCCCCCGGGGGPDPQFARWSLWMDEVFDFKQMVVWDKGPMGMGWHYRRSYEVVLVGQKPGAACKWYDTTNAVENIIRGVNKIIPRGGKPVLDSTCTVKLLSWEQEVAPCEAQEVVQLLKKVTSAFKAKGNLKWSIAESGESITVQCRRGSLSTTLMGINKIIALETSNYSMPSHTRGSTVDATLMSLAIGGSPVESVENRSLSQQGTISAMTGFPQAVKNAAFAVLLEISKDGAWTQKLEGGDHPTSKPVALAAHFIKLHSQPGDTVLDPFCGGGSTLEAARALGREALGIDLDPEHVAACEARARNTGLFAFTSGGGRLV